MRYIVRIWLLMVGLLWMLPVVGLLLGPRQILSPSENRKLAEFPVYAGQPFQVYLQGIEDYWNDHLGFRDRLVFWHHYGLWAGFGESGVSWVTIGKDGWLFYGGDQSNEDVLGRVCLSDEDLKQWAGVLQAKKDWFESLGIRYLFLIAPNKQSVYPEKLPEWMQRHAVSVRRIDRLVEVLRKHTDVEIIDLREALLQEKDRYPVYFRTDSHWNWQGAYVAYRKLIRRLCGWFPDMEPLPESQMIETIREFRHGDLRMGLDDVIWEKERVWLPAETCSTWNGTVFDRYLYEKRCATSRIRAIVLRDSFMDYIEPYLSEHFGDVVYIWKRWAEDSGTEHRLYKEWIEKIHPNLVIEERAERLIGQIPAATLEQRFDYSGPFVGHWNGESGFDGIVLHQQAWLERSHDGLLIHATGMDPGVRLPDMGQDIGPLILRIEMESPADTALQIFYPTASEKGYTEENSRGVLLKKGQNTVYLCIEEPTVRGPLRLDPGYAVGTYRLRSLEIRRDRLESLFQEYDAGRMYAHTGYNP